MSSWRCRFITMSIATKIVGEGTKENAVRVTKYGQLVVAPIEYSQLSFAFADLINVGYNLVKPEQNKTIIITEIILNANRNVSNTTGANVELYCTEGGPDTTTITFNILKIEMLRNSSMVLTGLNLQIPEGSWINIKTDDDDISASVYFYRVPVSEG